uniref:Uncharacterized protein n=1 Tax=Amphimedon queenslandica TaxID=400682 RepID=A0A1X7U9D7_AMPQE
MRRNEAVNFYYTNSLRHNYIHEEADVTAVFLQCQNEWVMLVIPDPSSQSEGAGAQTKERAPVLLQKGAMLPFLQWAPAGLHLLEVAGLQLLEALEPPSGGGGGGGGPTSPATGGGGTPATGRASGGSGPPGGGGAGPLSPATGGGGAGPLSPATGGGRPQATARAGGGGCGGPVGGCGGGGPSATGGP